MRTPSICYIAVADLSKLSWSDLMAQRYKHRGNQSMQDMLAPYEHGAWAREQVSANPLLAPAYAAMVPGYQLYRLAVGQEDDMSSRPSLKHIAEGWRGTAEGVSQGLRRLFSR